MMRGRRHLDPMADDNFGILASDTIMGLWKNLTGAIATTMVGVVSVFLVIGGVVIMNVMLASVTERTREIGVRKSLGARRQRHPDAVPGGIRGDGSRGRHDRHCHCLSSLHAGESVHAGAIPSTNRRGDFVACGIDDRGIVLWVISRTPGGQAGSHRGSAL